MHCSELLLDNFSIFGEERLLSGHSAIKPRLVEGCSDGLDLTIFSMTSPGMALLFTPETDCVLVGDSEGQVPVYEPKNLPDGGSTQMENLEDVIRSTLSSQHTLGKTDGDTYCRRVRLFVLTSPSS
ncbi:dynein axonemal intermediate chain 4-like [Carassius gibelio]|uniref:dynein axonemal intermediate chain 4-like n=1 Tax=Carassius gibelio TaxID=101364 RepID=UPI002278F4AD|nr:dynein axonemal intermediate chain 4-like [Carassius gibelio]